jgi:predicted P-loop ATPase
VDKLIGPLKELSLQVGFDMIEDERNIDIWHSYILFFDEMGYASKANVDTIKHAITATHLSRRPMRTNTKVSVAQNATFTGCSNKTLAQLIKDPTGIRRFVSAQFSSAPDYSVVNATNYQPKDRRDWRSWAEETEGGKSGLEWISDLVRHRRKALLRATLKGVVENPVVVISNK